MNLLAKVISTILAPLIIVIPVVFYLVYISTESIYLSFLWTLTSFTFILSLLIVIWVLVKKKIFSDMDVSTQKQRPLLYSLEFIWSLVYVAILYFFHAPKELFIGIISIFLLLISLGIANRFIKASGHVAILSAVVMLLFFMQGPIYLLGFVLVGILAWSRLRLKRHTPKEVLVGGIIGVLIVVALAVI